MAQIYLSLDVAMSNEIDYANNPLHGVSLNTLLTEIVEHYGFEILFAYLNINCFKTNPSIESSVKFLKKTEWARHKVEVFYLYEFKNLPRASSEQFKLPPRERIVPKHQTPREPAELSLEDAQRLHEKRAKKAAAHTHGAGHRTGKGRKPAAKRVSRSSGDHSPSSASRSDRGTSGVVGKPGVDKSSPADPWANSRK